MKFIIQDNEKKVIDTNNDKLIKLKSHGFPFKHAKFYIIMCVIFIILLFICLFLSIFGINELTEDKKIQIFLFLSIIFSIQFCLTFLYDVITENNFRNQDSKMFDKMTLCHLERDFLIVYLFDLILKSIIISSSILIVFMILFEIIESRWDSEAFSNKIGDILMGFIAIIFYLLFSFLLFE